MKSPKALAPRRSLLRQRIGADYGVLGSSRSAAAQGKSKNRAGTVREGEGFMAM